MKCTWTIARYSVETDAMPAKNIAAPMNTQYRLSNVTPESIVPDLYLMLDSGGENASIIRDTPGVPAGYSGVTTADPG